VGSKLNEHWYLARQMRAVAGGGANII
jgi:hypothetical protein